LDALVKLLRDRDRAWAAEVLLSALTRREEKLVESFVSAPDEWWQTFGANAAERWRAWLDGARDRLVWDAAAGYFVERLGTESTSDVE
jgi:hypothetical protein